MDEVGLLTVENRTPWAATSRGLTRKSWRLKNPMARALVDQDQLEDSSFNVFDPDDLGGCPPGAAHGGLYWAPRPQGLINEAEDVSSPTHSLIFNQNNLAAVSGQHAGQMKSTPAVDFPFQFNFGSIYSSSLTIYFDN